jgi:hypothetical protein
MNESIRCPSSTKCTQVRGGNLSTHDIYCFIVFALLLLLLLLLLFIFRSSHLSPPFYVWELSLSSRLEHNVPSHQFPCWGACVPHATAGTLTDVGHQFFALPDNIVLPKYAHAKDHTKRLGMLYLSAVRPHRAPGGYLIYATESSQVLQKNVLYRK